MNRILNSLRSFRILLLVKMECLVQLEDEASYHMPDLENCARLIAAMSSEECMRGNKLEKSSVAMNNVPRHELPFNRHTVTIGVGNKRIDFETSLMQHEKIKKEQRTFADKIEMEKADREKVQTIDDYKINNDINDLAINRARCVDDACAQSEEVQIEKSENEVDVNGIVHVRGAYARNRDCVKPRDITPHREHISNITDVML